MYKNINWLVQFKTTKTLLQQLLIIYPLGTQGLTYLILYHIMFLQNLIYIHKRLFVVNGNLFLIIFIFYFLLSIPALLFNQALLVGLLGIIGGINGRGIVVNLIQLFWISAKKGLGNIIIKDIKGILLLRPKLLKRLKTTMELFKNRNSL